MDTLLYGLELPALVVTAINRRPSSTTLRRQYNFVSIAKKRVGAQEDRGLSIRDFRISSAQGSPIPICVGAGTSYASAVAIDEFA